MMAQRYITTNHIPLFNGDYYGQALIEYFTNTANKTLTVTVLGVRVYSKYGYNFTTTVDCVLGGDNNPICGSTKILRSGSNRYTGYSPSSDVQSIKSYNGGSITKTFKYTSEGKPPSIALRLSMHANGIKYLSAGANADAKVELVTDNLAGSDYLNISPLNVDPVQFNTTYTTNYSGDKVKIAIKTCVLNKYNANKWEVYLDNKLTQTIQGASTYKGFSTQISTTPNAPHVIKVKVQNAANGKWSEDVSDTIDCTLPKIYGAKLEAYQEQNNVLATLTYSCSYLNQIIIMLKDEIILDWTLPTCTDTKAGKYALSGININANTAQTYTIRIRRIDAPSFSSSTETYCDAILPSLQFQNVRMFGDLLQAEAICTNVLCRDWQITVNAQNGNDLYDGEDNLPSPADKVKFQVSNLEYDTVYTMSLTATNNNNKLTSTITLLDIVCNNCSKLYVNGSYVNAIPIIFNEGKWTMTSPCIYNTKWEECKAI